MSAVTEERPRFTSWRRPRLRADRLIIALTAVLFALGAMVRLRQFFSGRSLWLDETLISLNFLDRSVSGLFHPLGLTQGGPIGWLLLEKASISVFGVSEDSLRIVSLISGLLVLFFGWDIARRIGGSKCALVALLLLACSPALIRYSNEVKQYETDVAASLAIIDATLFALRDTRRWRGPALFSLAGTLGVLCSHSAVFSLVPAVAVALLAHRNYRKPEWLLSLIAPVAALAAQYFITIRPLSNNFIFMVGWRSGYPPFLASVPRRITWAPGAIGRLASNPVHAHVPVLLGLLLLAGTWALYRRSRAGLWLLAAPFLLILGAALDYRYPMADRLALVLVPSALIVVSLAATSPIVAGAGVVSRLSAVVAAGCCVALAVPWVGTWTRLMASPQTVTELRPVLRQLQREIQPGQDVVSYSFMAPQYAFYARELRLPLGSSLGLYAGGCPDNGVLSRVTSSGQFWFVWTALNSKVAPMAPKPGDAGSIEDVAAVLERIGLYATPHRRIAGNNAGAVEFTLSARTGTGSTAGRCLGALPPQARV